MSKKGGSGKNLAEVVDQGTGRFVPRARILRAIGADLISSEVVAVLELVKNCYDADATTAKIRLWTPGEGESGSLEIEDNGRGIDREILLGPWLEPATDHKLGSQSPDGSGEISPGGRRRLGSKGVGRFAAQKLGHVLTVISRAPSSETEIEAVFRWKEYEEQSKYLHEIEIPWREKLPGRLKNRNGTLLEISDLCDDWSEELVETLRVGLSRLVSPAIGQDKFRVEFYLNGAVGEVIETAIDHVPPMYSVRGELRVGGHCEIEYSDVTGSKELWERKVSWHEDSQNCGSFAFAVNTWDLDREALEPFLSQVDSQSGLRNFRRLIRQHSGINLYRDGFRILPYGEPDNDWLRLDRRRVNNPTMRLSNNQIFGVIHLGATSNPDLLDQTNREGLISNDAYRHLREVVLDILGYIETRRYRSRRDRGIGGGQRGPSEKIFGEKHKGRLLELLDGFGRSGKNGRSLKDIHSEIEAWSTQTVDSLKTYAALASRGQMAGMVFSQLDQPVRRIAADLESIEADLTAGIESPDDLEVLQNRTRQAKESVKIVRQTIRKMDPLALDRRVVRPERVNLREMVGGVLAVFEDELDKNGIFLEQRRINNIELLTFAPIFQNALANVIDNALYWAAADNPNGTPIVRISGIRSGCKVLNNGVPIPDDYLPLIFDPHFTTRLGRPGLGLTLSRDLLRSIGGELTALNKKGWVEFSLVVASA